MGQNSSKRRSKGRNKNGTYTNSETPNVDDPNWSITTPHKTGDGEQGQSPPTSPASATPRSPASVSGKKEKRKRFRVGFPLNRTPSGRWTRKKKSSFLNGTRPVSCPEPLRPEPGEKPSRPHSLFLEELDIPEEDTKIETVDLSDNEENKTRETDRNKSTPKAPERSKWKQGSYKKGSGKKKKKDKEPSKKEKKKQQKSEDVRSDVTRRHVTIPTQVTVELPNKAEHTIDGLRKDGSTDVLKIDGLRKDGSTDVPKIDGLRKDGSTDVLKIDGLRKDGSTDVLKIDGLRKYGSTDALKIDGLRKDGSINVPKIDGLRKDGSTDVLKIDGLRKDGSTDVLKIDGLRKDGATDVLKIDGLRKDGSTDVPKIDGLRKDGATDVPKIDGLKKDGATDVLKIEKQHLQEPDITKIASTIVAQTLEVAQTRLRAETCNNTTSSFPNHHSVEHVNHEPASIKRLNTSTENAATRPNDNQQELQLNAPIESREINDPASHVAKAKAQVIDKSIEAIPKHSLEMDFHKTEHKNDAGNAKNEIQQMSLPIINNFSNEKSENFLASCHSHLKTESSCPVHSASMHSSVLLGLEQEESEEFGEDNDDSEAIAKEIVASVIAASVEIVRKDNYVDGNDDVVEPSNRNPSDLHKNTKSSKIEQETKEKTSLEVKKKKEKTKKSGQERDRNNAEGNVGVKIEKEKKSKSETKEKTTKKLSSWFKKDKTSKAASGTTEEKSAARAAKQVPHGTISGHTTEIDQNVESATHHVQHNSKEFQTPDNSSSFNPNLSLNVSGTRLTPTESSCDYSEALSPSSSISPTSPSSSISPTSPNSDISEITRSPSDTDKSLSSSSSFLKKISIGSRLRTAILRKKSSGSSDDQERTTPVIKKPKNSEPSVLTPPPRKSRKKKTEQDFADSPRTTHNADSPSTASPVSPIVASNVHLTKSAPRSVSAENNIPTDDSGIADLTPQEEDQSASTWYDQCKEDNVVKLEVKTPIKSTRYTNLLEETAKENLETYHVDEDSNDDQDDTRPLPQTPQRDKPYLQEFDVHSKSMDYYSPIQSPTLVSTATIILRSTSSDDDAAFKDQSFTKDTSRNLKKHTGSKFHHDSVPNIEEWSRDSVEPKFAFTREASDRMFNLNAQESSSDFDNHHQDTPKRKTKLSLAHEAVETSVVQASLENDNDEPWRDVDFIRSPESAKEKLVQKFSHPQARTIAEYEIGEVADPADNTRVLLFQKIGTDQMGNAGNRPGSEPTVPHTWIEIAGTTDSTSTDPDNDDALNDESSHHTLEQAFHTSTTRTLEHHSSGSNERADRLSAAMSEDEPTLSHNEELEDDNSNNNRLHGNELFCLSTVKALSNDGHKDNSEFRLEQRNVGSIEASNTGSDNIDKADPRHVIYQALPNGDRSNLEGRSNRNTSVIFGEKDCT